GETSCRGLDAREGVPPVFSSTRHAMATPNDEGVGEPARPSLTRGLPSFGSYYSPDGQDAEIVHHFRCGACETFSSDVRSYALPTLVLLPIVGACRVDTVMKCPRCMRQHILSGLPLAVLLSHLASPLVVLWWSAVFIKTFFRHAS